MKPTTAIYAAKKLSDCNILVGMDPVQIRFAEAKFGVKALELEEFSDHHVQAGKLYLVSVSSKIQVVNEKLASKIGIWDALTPLDPNSEGIKELLEEACRRVDVKPTKELVQSAQWRLFEGSGGIRDVEASVLEAMQWVLLPQDPKPDLPWFNPQGHFRLSNVHRELKGYVALMSGDQETAKALGAREKVLKWNLDPSGVERSRKVLEEWNAGNYTEEATRLILRAIWEPIRLPRKRS
jgi:hypothetical protein